MIVGDEDTSPKVLGSRWHPGGRLRLPELMGLREPGVRPHLDKEGVLGNSRVCASGPGSLRQQPLPSQAQVLSNVKAF